MRNGVKWCEIWVCDGADPGDEGHGEYEVVKNRAIAGLHARWFDDE